MDDDDGARRDRNVDVTDGDAFDGTKDANGFGKNEVLIADGLSTGAIAGSGSALCASLLGSCGVNGSAGVNDCWDATMSSHMSRNFVFRG